MVLEISNPKTMKARIWGLTLSIAIVISSCGDKSDDSPKLTNKCQENPVFAIAESQTDANIGQSNGTVNITATGGTGPYTFALNGGPKQSTGLFTGLPAGDHQVDVEDSKGCTTNVAIRIVESIGNVPSFANDIQPIISTRCAIPTCHVPGGSTPFALQTYAQIKANAERIKVRTEARTMPPSGSTQLTDTEIMMISDWVEAGAPNN